MEIVTDVFQMYRTVARTVWNTAFWQDDDLCDWDGRDGFEDVKRALFEAIVVGKLGQHSQFLVFPRTAFGVPIQIEQPRPGDRNRYWDHPISTLKAGDAQLAFTDYFDWDHLGCLDFKFVRVKILSFPSASELVGREALIEVEYAEIGLPDDVSTDLGSTI